MTLSEKESKIFIKIARRGFPAELRPHLWMMGSGAARAIRDNPGYY